MEEEGSCRGARRPKPVLGGADDLISALPDELLLQILLRLGYDCGRCLDRGSACSSAAARTSRLSRRWRRLWTRLSRLTIRHAPLDSGHLRSVLASIHAGNAPAVANPPPQTRRRPGPPSTDLNPLVPPPALAVLVPHLDICVPRWTHDLGMQHGHGAEEEIPLVLDAAVMLAPVDFRFAAEGTGVQVSFPRFHHATSIQLQGLDLVFTESGPEFPALQTLFLSRCRTTLSCWVRRSPHLRVLRVSEPGRDSANIIIVKSKSLQELSVDCGDNHPEHSTDHVRIEAPLLKQLTMSFGTSRGRAMNILVSVSAPMLEKVSWKCTYATATAGLARWGLLYVILKPDVQGQLPNIHALSLIAETHSSYRFSGAEEELRFQMEVEKHMVFHFSMLELRIRTSGHVYGAFASRVLGMDRIKTVLKSLKIVLWRSENEEVCPDNCPCDEPNWRTKSIYLPKLEEVEIKGFKGEDHELDFWKLVIARAPKLKRVVMVRPSYEVTSEMRRILQTYGLDKILVLVSRFCMQDHHTSKFMPCTYIPF